MSTLFVFGTLGSEESNLFHHTYPYMILLWLNFIDWGCIKFLILLKNKKIELAKKSETIKETKFIEKKIAKK